MHSKLVVEADCLLSTEIIEIKGSGAQLGGNGRAHGSRSEGDAESRAGLAQGMSKLWVRELGGVHRHGLRDDGGAEGKEGVALGADGLASPSVGRGARYRETTLRWATGAHEVWVDDDGWGNPRPVLVRPGGGQSRVVNLLHGLGIVGPQRRGGGDGLEWEGDGVGGAGNLLDRRENGGIPCLVELKGSLEAISPARLGGLSRECLGGRGL